MMFNVIHSLMAHLGVKKNEQDKINTHGDETVFVDCPPFTLSMRIRKHQEEESKKYNIKKKNYKWTHF